MPGEEPEGKNTLEVDSRSFSQKQCSNQQDYSEESWRTGENWRISEACEQNSLNLSEKLTSRIRIISISHGKTWTWRRNGIFKREKQNHIKARIDKTQQNSKFRLCGDKDETINYIISECSKLTQKEYKTRHDWVGKLIHRKMSKQFKFEHTNKWYMHNPAPILKNNT